MNFIQLSSTRQFVPQCECDALLEKQFYARVWINNNPFANLMRWRLKHNMRRWRQNNVVPIR